MNRESAVALRKQLGIAGKIDLYEVADHLGLSIREVEADGFDGALVRSTHEVRGIVFVKRAMRDQGRKRFTIAHEIGHYVLHADARISCGSDDIESWSRTPENPERQADEFAAELLLPSAEVRQLVGKQWPSFLPIMPLCDMFGASLTAAARKYCDLISQRCAVVYSVKRIISWIHPSPSFNYWVPVGNKVGYDSIAARAFDGKPVPNGMEEVPAENWVSSYWLLKDARIQEQAIAMPSYEACISLLWANRDLENKPSEEGQLLEELDPNHFDSLTRKRWPSKK
jgi:hypothetical protein